MFFEKNCLKVTADEMNAIEGALNTQVKILNLQATARGGEAHSQLSQARQALATIAQHKPRKFQIKSLFTLGRFRRPCIFC